MAGKYEGSKADERADKAGAKKAGISLAKWEKSGADKRADVKGQKAMAAKAKKRR
ncbi:MAG: hypothetical protein NTX56_04420 [Proteobacteria bacterium]|nr:hypothetical protein [Pseudomonadota bacterium]